MARVYYETFRVIASGCIFCLIALTTVFRVAIVDIYTDIPSIRAEALKGIWLLLFNIYPDLYKGMLKGIIKAKGIQKKAAKVHLLTHWGIFPTLTYLFAFRMELGIVGLWLAKIGLECSLVVCYTLIINSVSWAESAEQAQRRIRQSTEAKAKG